MGEWLRGLPAVKSGGGRERAGQDGRAPAAAPPLLPLTGFAGFLPRVPGLRGSARLLPGGCGCPVPGCGIAGSRSPPPPTGGRPKLCFACAHASQRSRTNRQEPLPLPKLSLARRTTARVSGRGAGQRRTGSGRGLWCGAGQSERVRASRPLARLPRLPRLLGHSEPPGVRLASGLVRSGCPRSRKQGCREGVRLDLGVVRDCAGRDCGGSGVRSCCSQPRAHVLRGRARAGQPPCALVLHRGSERARAACPKRRVRVPARCVFVSQSQPSGR